MTSNIDKPRIFQILSVLVALILVALIINISGSLIAEFEEKSGASLTLAIVGDLIFISGLTFGLYYLIQSNLKRHKADS